MSTSDERITAGEQQADRNAEQLEAVAERIEQAHRAADQVAEQQGVPDDVRRAAGEPESDPEPEPS